MVRTALFCAVLLIGLAVVAIPDALAGCTYDMNGVGYPAGCPYLGGRGAPPANYTPPPSPAEIAAQLAAQQAHVAAQQAHALNEQGLAVYNSKDYAAADGYFAQALALAPSDSVIARNLANAQNYEGIDAFKRGDYQTALSYFQQALSHDPANDPDRHVISDDLDYAKIKIEDVQRAQEQHRQDAIAATNMQQSIQQYAQTLNAAPPSGGLEFGGGSSSGKSEHSGGLAFMDANSNLKDAVADTPANQQADTPPQLADGSAAKAGPDGARRQLKSGAHVATTLDAGTLEERSDKARKVFDTPGEAAGTIAIGGVYAGVGGYKEPVVPAEKRTDAIRVLEKQRTDLKSKLVALNEKLKTLDPNKDAKEYVETKQARSQGEYDLHRTNLSIGEAIGAQPQTSAPKEPNQAKTN